MPNRIGIVETIVKRVQDPRPSLSLDSSNLESWTLTLVWMRRRESGECASLLVLQSSLGGKRSTRWSRSSMSADYGVSFDRGQGEWEVLLAFSLFYVHRYDSRSDMI